MAYGSLSVYNSLLIGPFSLILQFLHSLSLLTSAYKRCHEQRNAYLYHCVCFCAVCNSLTELDELFPLVTLPSLKSLSS
jgi:hypothetical protein